MIYAHFQGVQIVADAVSHDYHVSRMFHVLYGKFIRHNIEHVLRRKHCDNSAES
jgi:hypothetical protein